MLKGVFFCYPFHLQYCGLDLVMYRVPETEMWFLNETFIQFCQILTMFDYFSNWNMHTKVLIFLKIRQKCQIRSDKKKSLHTFLSITQSQIALVKNH